MIDKNEAIVTSEMKTAPHRLNFQMKTTHLTHDDSSPIDNRKLAFLSYFVLLYQLKLSMNFAALVISHLLGNISRVNIRHGFGENEGNIILEDLGTERKLSSN